MGQVCRHGVPLRTTRVAFNDACARCNEEREAYDRQTDRIGGGMAKRYREGEFDSVQEEHIRDHTHDPGTGRFWDDMRIDLSRKWSGIWKDRRQMGIDRRREEVRRLLEQPVRLPLWLDDLLTECREEFTDPQFQALVYRYGYTLSHREAADALGLRSRHSFRKRLDGAERKVRHLRGDVLEEIRADEEARAEWRELEEQRAQIHAEVQREIDYLLPLTRRQVRWTKAVDRLWGLQPA